jgi:hypothetical protein
VIVNGSRVLRTPSNQQIAECLGFNDAINQAQVRDVCSRSATSGREA